MDSAGANRRCILKMDELVYSMEGARIEVAAIEAKTTDDLVSLRRSGDAADEELRDRDIG